MSSEQEQFNQKASTWFGVELKTWIPILVVLISLIGYIQMLYYDVQTLKARADSMEIKHEKLTESLNNIDKRLVAIEANTNFSAKNLKQLKEFFGIP